MTHRAVARGIGFIGAALVVAAVIWWAILYIQVYFNTGMPMVDTLPCMIQTSDLCTLAVALCKGRHFLGIKWYSTDLWWVGIVVMSGSLVINAIGRRA